jgi:hypothetical protein
MRQITLTLSLFLLSLCCYSQAINIGVRGGLTIPNIVAGGDNPLSQGYSSRIAGGGGLLAELEFNNTFALRLGVEYSGQGGKRDGVQAMSSNQLITDMTSRMGVPITEEVSAILAQVVTSPVFYADVKNTAKFDYLMIPLSAQAGKNINDGPWRVYVNAGPFVSFLLRGEQISKGQSKLYLTADKSQTFWSQTPPILQATIKAFLPEFAEVMENGTEFESSVITKELNSVNVGAQGNVGLSYQYNRHKFFIEAGGNYGFRRIQKDESNGSNHIGAATVMLGYAIRVK